MKFTSKVIERWKLEGERAVQDPERAKEVIQQQASRVVVLCEQLIEGAAIPAERALAIALTEWLASDADDNKYQTMIDKHEEWKRSYIEGES